MLREDVIKDVDLFFVNVSIIKENYEKDEDFLFLRRNINILLIEEEGYLLLLVEIEEIEDVWK